MNKLLATSFLSIITIAIHAQNLTTFQTSNNKKGIVDKNNEIVIPAMYDDIELISDGLVIVKLNNRYGCIDQSGKFIIPLKYESISPFSDGYVRVKLSWKVGIIDQAGKEVLP